MRRAGDPVSASLNLSWRADPKLRLALTLVCLCFVVAPLVGAHDWPHFHGPRSNGVAMGVRAPDHWSETDGVVWRTEIDGSGISSPVSVGRRVYITTAISRKQRTTLRLMGDSLVGCLALFGIPILAYHRWRRDAIAFAGRRPFRFLEELDCVLFTLIAIAVFVFGIAMAVGPEALNAVLHALRDVGVTVARSLGRVQTNLSFVTWAESAPHNHWIISSLVALASLGLVPFLSRRHSGVRAASAVTLLAGVALSAAYVPWPEEYSARVAREMLVALYSPLVGLALWHALPYFVDLLRLRGRETTGTTERMPLASVVPAALSLAMFVSPNCLPPSEAVVTRRLVCVDAASGQKIWQTDAFTTKPETTSALNSYATPTPSVAGDTIVAAFGPGLAAFNLDGQLLWSKAFPGWIENSVYGAGSSPVVDEQSVFVTNDREIDAHRQSQVVAYSLKNGTELWRQSPQFAHDGYATSVTHHDGYHNLLLALTSKTVAAYVASTGDVAWQLKIPVEVPIPSLIADSNKLYVTGATGGGGYTAAYSLRQKAAPEELWRSNRSPADVSSPVLYKGRLFTITSTGIMVCYDAESGAVIWKQRVGSGLGVFYASLVAADDKIYAIRSSGTTYVIAAEDQFRLISESSLPEEIFASPAFGADCLLLRTTAALYCIRGQTPAADQTSS
jgi:outer membrane protein assembly factor BamB